MAVIRAAVVLGLAGCLFMGIGIYIGAVPPPDKVEDSSAQELRIQTAWAFAIIGIIFFGCISLAFVFT